MATLLVGYAKAVVKVEIRAMDNATVEVLVDRNAKVAIKTIILIEVRDMVNVWVTVMNNL